MEWDGEKVPSYFLLHFIQHLLFLILLLLLILALVLDCHAWEGGEVDVSESSHSGTALIPTMEVDKKRNILLFYLFCFLQHPPLLTLVLLVLRQIRKRSRR